ncbi:MAG: DUF2240 family protein, partial [Candidatus Thorarchaeota archaeon]|nr:DUF2240 family protein [Candidatus Thorarchaeota archaeon]
MLTLEEIIELILKHTKYERKDVLELIDAKREELGRDIVNDDSAAMIVAREHGIDLHQLKPKARTRIEDITESTRSVVLTAKVVGVDRVRTFTRPDGSEGRVASMTVGDETGRIRIALWDEMAKAIEEEEVKVGSIVQISGAYVKKGLRDTLELNLGRMGRIRTVEDDEIDFDIEVPAAASTKLGELKENLFDISVTFVVRRTFPVSTFTRSTDGSEGKVMSVIGADETGTARVIFWDSLAEQMADVEEGEVVRLNAARTKRGRTGEIEVHSGRTSAVDRRLKVKMQAVDIAKGTQPASPSGKASIDTLTADMRDVDIEGRVVTVDELRTFEKGEKKGRRQSIIVGDDTGSVRVTFWNEDVEKLVKVKVGDAVRIRHLYAREGLTGGVELHVGQRAEIEVNPKGLKLDHIDLSDFQSVPTAKPVQKSISEITEEMVNKSVEITGVIMAFGETEPTYLSCSNPECKKKVTEEDDHYVCEIHGVIKNPVPRYLFKMT